MTGPMCCSVFHEHQLHCDGGPYGTPPPHNQSLSYDHLIQQQNEDISGADGLPGKLRVLHEQLAAHNACDKMVTYDIWTEEWVRWEL